jgi:hypothetical protein
MGWRKGQAFLSGSRNVAEDRFRYRENSCLGAKVYSRWESHQGARRRSLHRVGGLGQMHGHLLLPHRLLPPPPGQPTRVPPLALHQTAHRLRAQRRILHPGRRRRPPDPRRAACRRRLSRGAHPVGRESATAAPVRFRRMLTFKRGGGPGPVVEGARSAGRGGGLRRRSTWNHRPRWVRSATIGA